MRSLFSIKNLLVSLIVAISLVATWILTPSIGYGVFGSSITVFPFLLLLIPSFFVSRLISTSRSELFFKMSIFSLIMGLLLVVTKMIGNHFFLVELYSDYGQLSTLPFFSYNVTRFVSYPQNFLIMSSPAIIAGALGAAYRLGGMLERYINLKLAEHENMNTLADLQVKADSNSAVQGAIKTLALAEDHANKLNFLHESEKHDMYLNQ